MNKVIITAAITGAVHIPSMSEYLPITPEQIINEAVAANKAGAAVVHLHARDPKTGQPTGSPELMKEIVDGIRSKCDVVIGVTTGGAIGMTSEERLAAIPAVKAELASCNAGSVNFCFSPIADKIKNPKFDWEIPFVKNTYTVPFANTFQGIEDYIRIMGEHGTKPEFEVYEVGMLSNIAYFVKKGLLKGPVYIQFVLGVMGGLPATVDNLLFLYNTAKKLLGDNFVWSCAGAGKDEFDITTAAIILGGNTRVGLEDNLYISRGVLAKSNAELVSKIKDIATTLDRKIATPDEAREILFSK
ncbi:3-keto-5-aminohexanoate cleavage protein [Clostridium sp. PL3]|uniref:3-keto-5-aminohexanoate cleavage protein n=1 Tax=Clostridium thailandense TaxID=2794346 RepID=A0A949U3I8_9CLOT|nr:3-keto-5-aminohexanoate cleavage protein [Clostridium thailandense]MBV7276805.1 3-keto-5-aminohexanoate cleavage protein [Clostridium thailandense]